MSNHISMWTSRWERGMARLARQRQIDLNRAPAPSKAEYLAQLVDRWRRKEELVSNLDIALKTQQAALRDLLETEIPDALDDADLEKVRLPDGSTLSAPTEHILQFLVEDEYKIYGWLRLNGFGDRIKRTVTVDFLMGEDALASKFITFLKKNLPDKWKDRAYIHDGTSRVIGREITEKGLTPPPELTIFPLRRAKIVRARRTKDLANEQDGS